jgi:hypothetical protein
MDKLLAFLILFLVSGCTEPTYFIEPERAIQASIEGFNKYDVSDFNQSDSCRFVTDLKYYWESASESHVPRIYSKRYLVQGHSSDHTSFDFCLIQDLENKDSIFYLGFKDIYQLKFGDSVRRYDSIPAITKFSSSRLRLLAMKLISSDSYESPYSLLSEFDVLINTIYVSRYENILNDSHRGISHFQKTYDPKKKIFNKDDELYHVYEVPYAGYIVFYVGIDAAGSIELEEYLISLNQTMFLKAHTESDEAYNCIKKHGNEN